MGCVFLFVAQVVAVGRMAWPTSAFGGVGGMALPDRARRRGLQARLAG